MNKAKVMQTLNSIDLGLNIIEEGQQLDTQALTESVRKDVEDLKEELNSKPVMPKVFDEWKKQYLNNRCELLYWVAELESGGEESKQDNDLSDWLFENGIDDTFFHRYQMCIEAILYGYEVEK